MLESNGFGCSEEELAAGMDICAGESGIAVGGPGSYLSNKVRHLCLSLCGFCLSSGLAFFLEHQHFVIQSVSNRVI